MRPLTDNFNSAHKLLWRLAGAVLALAVSGTAIAATTPPALTAVTLNIWHDQHEWPARRTVIVDSLRALAPDVIFLQEVLEHEGLPNQAAQLADSLGCSYVFASVDPPGAAKRYGNAILTPHKIIAWQEVKLAPLDDYRVAAHARIELGSGRGDLDAYVTHLHHTAEGAAIRATQVAGLLAFVDSTRAPGDGASLLIGGDFNAAPATHELAPMRARYTDALIVSGAPEATTLNPAMGHTPVRIDYLWCEPHGPLQPQAARVILGAPTPAGVWASDHFGVWARFAVVR